MYHKNSRFPSFLSPLKKYFSVCLKGKGKKAWISFKEH